MKLDMKRVNKKNKKNKHERSKKRFLHVLFVKIFHQFRLMEWRSSQEKFHGLHCNLTGLWCDEIGAH